MTQSIRPAKNWITFPISKHKILPHENYGDWELQGPARKTCNIYGKGLYESQRNHMYVVDKPCDIYRLQGNPMIVVGFPRNL